MAHQGSNLVAPASAPSGPGDRFGHRCQAFGRHGSTRCRSGSGPRAPDCPFLPDRDAAHSGLERLFTVWQRPPPLSGRRATTYCATSVICSGLNAAQTAASHRCGPASGDGRLMPSGVPGTASHRPRDSEALGPTHRCRWHCLRNRSGTVGRNLQRTRLSAATVFVLFGVRRPKMGSNSALACSASSLYSEIKHSS